MHYQLLLVHSSLLFFFLSHNVAEGLFLLPNVQAGLSYSLLDWQPGIDRKHRDPEGARHELPRAYVSQAREQGNSYLHSSEKQRTQAAAGENRRYEKCPSSFQEGRETQRTVSRESHKNSG